MVGGTLPRMGVLVPQERASLEELASKWYLSTDSDAGPASFDDKLGCGSLSQINSFLPKFLWPWCSIRRVTAGCY